MRELAQDHRNALSRWQPKLAGLREDYLLAAERLEEAKIAYGTMVEQTKGSKKGTALVAVAQAMVSTTMLQAQKIEEDMDRYMEFSSNVCDGMSRPVLYRAMEETVPERCERPISAAEGVQEVL